MHLNLGGLWRLLVVLYGLIALTIIAAVVFQERSNASCRADRPRQIAEHGAWEHLPPCNSGVSSDHCDGASVVTEPWVDTCEAPGTATMYGVLALVGSAVVVFGGALVVRWVYRGFLPPTAGPS